VTYIEELQDAIRHLYNTEAVYVETVPVKEVFQGQTVWEGEVEVFDVPELPEANRIYAWAHDTDNVDQPRRTVTVLHVAPVLSPELAVRASILQDYRNSNEHH
jgi:hypothetical protein